MNDKNLLERLGIIQRVDIDEGDEETTRIAVKVEDFSDNLETAAEIAPDVTTAEPTAPVGPPLRFVTSIAETMDNKPTYNLHEEQNIAPDYLVDTKAVVNAGDEPSLSEIIEEPTTYQMPVMPEPVLEPMLESMPAYIPEPVSVEPEPDPTPYIPEAVAVNEEPEEITLPVIDRQAVYAQYAPEAIAAAQQATADKQYLDTEKYSSISDLYKTYGKKLGGTDTIFIVDAFVKSLPDTLSINLKRQSVLNIIAASNINLEELVADGLSRIDNLNSFLNLFEQHTQQITTTKEEQIAQLERQISALKREVKERNRLQEKQEAAIDFETQKIKTSLEFIANNDDFGE